MTKAISLSAELAEVRCAVEGARFIADALATHSLDSREQELQAPVSTAVHTSMRKGELLALRKSDVDLAAGTLRMGRSHASETTKGNREDLLPVAVGLVPFLWEAMATAPSERLFPGRTARSTRRTSPCTRCCAGRLAVPGWWRGTVTSAGARAAATRRRRATPSRSPAPLCHEALALSSPPPAPLP